MHQTVGNKDQNFRGGDSTSLYPPPRRLQRLAAPPPNEIIVKVMTDDR